MRAKCLGAALAVLLLTSPSPAADNAVQTVMGLAIEKAYQSRLKKAEELAGEISEPLSKGEDPASKVRSFVSFLESTFGAVLSQALKDVSSEQISDEQARHKALDGLAKAAGKLSPWLASARASLGALEKGLNGLDREYKGAIDDMEDAAKDVLSADEVGESERRFDELQRRGELLFDDWAEADARSAGIVRELEGCGSAGKSLAVSLQGGRRRFSDARDKLERSFEPLLDWRGCRSPAGVLLIQHTKDARAKAAWAKKELQETIERYEASLDGASLLKRVNEMHEQAQTEYGKDHHYATGDKFRSDGREMEVVLGKLKSGRAELFDLIREGPRDAKEALDRSLEAVLKFAADKNHAAVLESMVSEAVKRLGSGAAAAEQKLEENGRLVQYLENRVAHLAEIADLVDDLQGVSRTEDETARAVRALVNSTWELFKILADPMVAKIQDLEEVFVKKSGALARIDAIRNAEAGKVRWSLWEKTKTLFGMGSKLASLDQAVGLVTNAITAGKAALQGIRASRVLISRSEEKRNEMVDSTDQTTANTLTEGIYNHLDGVGVNKPEDIAGKLTADKLDVANTTEGDRALDGLTANVQDVVVALNRSGEDGDKALAASLSRLPATVRRAFKAIGLEARAEIDAVGSMIVSFRKERVALREEQIELLVERHENATKQLDAVADSAAEKKKDEAEDALEEAAGEIEDLDVDAVAADFDKEYAEAKTAMENAEEEVEEAEESEK